MPVNRKDIFRDQRKLIILLEVTTSKKFYCTRLIIDYKYYNMKQLSIFNFFLVNIKHTYNLYLILTFLKTLIHLF